jgi:hypothetical protein
MVSSPYQVVFWIVVVSHPSDEERKIRAAACIQCAREALPVKASLFKAKD